MNDRIKPTGASEAETFIENAVLEAQKFFLERFAIRINDDGSLMGELSEVQLQALAQWRDEGFENGVEMPTFEKFFQKTLLAVALWPQKSEQKINYLFGKGHAVELALQGEIVGRRRISNDPTFRQHADFDLYDVTQVPPEMYKKVFGATEIYPPEKTKGLSQLPSTLLANTAETVLLGNVSVYIPQLELLFIDKVLKRESTPRPEGFDAFMLAKHYELQREKIHSYLESYVISPQKQILLEEKENSLRVQLNGIKNLYNMSKAVLAEDLSPDEKPAHADVMKKLRKAMTEVFVGTTQTQYWVDAADDEISETGIVISDGLMQRIQVKVDQVSELKLQELDLLHVKFDELLELARQAREA